MAVTYLAVLLGMTFIERWLVYPAPSADSGDWAPAGDDYTDAWIDVPPVKRGGDATRVHGWYFHRDDADHALLYCHGNGEDVSDQPQLARLLRDRLNASVLVFDYRGYGQSAGTPHEAGVVADGLAAQRWLAERAGIEPDAVVLVGRSLGGAVAIACAADQGARALVLQSTFTRLTDVAAEHHPLLPVRWAMRNRYDSLERLARYGGPVLVSHGTADRVVPYPHGEKLHEAAKGPKRFVEFPQQTHNQPQPPSYYDELVDFLRETTDADLASRTPSSAG